MREKTSSGFKFATEDIIALKDSDSTTVNGIRSSITQLIIAFLTSELVVRWVSAFGLKEILV